jgi:putative transposase
MRKPRKNSTPVEKVASLRRHRIDHVPVSDLCDEHQLSPTVFYLWQKPFFENGPAAFEPKNAKPDGHLQRIIAALRDKLQRKNEVVAELMEEHIQLKRAWGALNGVWVPHDTRDSIIDFVRHWAERTEIPVQRFLGWLGIAASKFHDWTTRYGLANEHNTLVPRDWWLEPWEKEAILQFHAGHPLEGYRRLAFMMLDADVVAVSPSSVYRVLRDAGLIQAQHRKPSKKGRL